jgi:tRNA-dihydrouridine synthase B
MLEIGSLRLKHPLVLAPLAGISDLPFRLICRLMGAPLAFIEMISVHAITHRNRKTLELLTTLPEDRPLGIQFLGRDPDALRAACEEVRERGCDLVDLNAACPVKKVAKRGEGAALMREPDALGRAVKALVDAADVPVTCKLRAGWDHDNINAIEAARAAEDAGASAVFIHGRTRSQQYRGEVDYQVIESVKEALSIPVFGSGDVFSAVHAKRMLDETGCDGVVMARGSMGNPWIFRETIEHLETGEILPRPGMQEITDMMLRHLDLCVSHYGEERAPYIYRKLFIWYTKGIPNVKPLRLKAVRSTSTDELRGYIAELKVLST